MRVFEALGSKFGLLLLQIGIWFSRLIVLQKCKIIMYDEPIADEDVEYLKRT